MVLRFVASVFFSIQTLFATKSLSPRGVKNLVESSSSAKIRVRKHKFRIEAGKIPTFENAQKVAMEPIGLDMEILHLAKWVIPPLVVSGEIHIVSYT